jgi:hypothetical protein
VLDRVLDQLEHGTRAELQLPPAPPLLIDLLSNEERKALKS